MAQNGPSDIGQSLAVFQERLPCFQRLFQVSVNGKQILEDVKKQGKSVNTRDIARLSMDATKHLNST